MFNRFAAWVFVVLGWKITGVDITKFSKSMLVVAPHASWYDVLLGIAAIPHIPIKINFLGKAELFKGIWASFFYKVGCLPVERSKSNNLVDSVVNLINSHEKIHIAIAPEGTRKNVRELKTGFYYMALKAKIPIILVAFDYPNKEFRFAEPFMPTGNFDEDKVIIAKFFKQVPGVQKDWINNYLEKQTV
jgi:1-acyl-sn-glycerol-3-phosphate acyltransferase